MILASLAVLSGAYITAFKGLTAWHQNALTLNVSLLLSYLLTQESP